MQLSTEQELAIEECCNTSQVLVCVTGQAGSGKTTILKNVHEELCSDLNLTSHVVNPDAIDIVLCAPTGRAAKRIEEATGIPAMTIHRMLRFSSPMDEDDVTLPKYTKFNPMPYKVILVDEASMISTELWRSLIDAMTSNAIVRFFGDINQLPPVVKDGKPESPFANAMKKFPTRTLTENFRSEDGIISVADKVIRGRMITNNSQVRTYRIKSTETINNVVNLADECDFTLMENQIIIPTTSTTYGCEKINTLIQTRYNPNKMRLTTFQRNPYDDTIIRRMYKHNDKVIWTKNDYNLGIMNGTLGRVVDFDLETGNMVINFDGTDTHIPSQLKGYNPTTGEEYTYDPRLQMMLGYAITTHRSQGSQFNTVLFMISRSRAATRQNVYTAVTRAKHELIVLNIAGALATAIDTRTVFT